jgi:tetratricopeptide (TPR) repeat protein
MKVKGFYLGFLLFFFSGLRDAAGQATNQDALQNISNASVNYQNSIANELEKFKYEPYVPTRIDPAISDAVYVKNRIQKILREYVIDRGKDNGETCYTKIGCHKFCCCLRELPELLFYMQYYYGKRFYIGELEKFRQVADYYQTLIEKPTISEEQRKYIVRANALNDNKDYSGAIQYYDKSNAVNPLSYPAGYYNLALIASLAGNYSYAILNMKKYLLLLPNAADAREAQDKIYGWEALTTKN